ncbi:MAG: hypothetical protein HZB43_03540 [candidate division Zixibacteria bacterium]|nr:hypothetical protein [candidate division Zixibacteria bacterium]
MSVSVSQTATAGTMTVFESAQRASVRATAATKSRSFSKLIWASLYVATLAFVAVQLVRGWDFYTTPLTMRPHHAEYAVLRPAGSLGVVYGIAGAAMMTLMLLYSVRKRARHASHLGTLRQWLNLHIYLGIMGPLFIVLHTSFKIQGLVAVSFWSMVGVGLSGFFGRYLYHQIPRSIQGAQLSMQELEEQGDEIANQLRSDFGLTTETIAKIDQMGVADLSEDMGFFRLFGSMIKSDLDSVIGFRVRQAELARALNLPEEHLDELMDLTRARFKLKRRTLMLGQVKQVFHYWHVIHKPFAIVMYVIMGVHITVALWTGYAWSV